MHQIADRTEAARIMTWTLTGRDSDRGEEDDMKPRTAKSSIDALKVRNYVPESVYNSHNQEKIKGQVTKILEENLPKDTKQGQSEHVDELELMASRGNVKVRELKEDTGKSKEAAAKRDSFLEQAQQLELTKIMLEDSKVEIVALRRKLGSSEEDMRRESSALHELNNTSLHEEVKWLKNELKSTSQAEVNSKKALDDMALALKEVATEAYQAKSMISMLQEEMEHYKIESEKLRENLKIIAVSHQDMVDEARREADGYRNTTERLRVEAEEAALTWHTKETEFVNCIKRTEEEKLTVLEENAKLLESVMECEQMSKAAKKESQHLRDILKQALNEANVAKEAAGIAKEENSQLKDILASKEDALQFITRENENLRVNEAAAEENIKALKRMLSEVTGIADPGDAGKHHELKRASKSGPVALTASDHREHKHGRKLSHTCSLNLKELIIPSRSKELTDEQKEKNKESEHNDDAECDDSDPLKGSIFDTVDSPVVRPEKQKKYGTSQVGSESEGTVTPEDCDPLDGGQSDDMDHERSSRKKKALLRRFGDIITKSLHKKEASVNETPGKEKQPVD